MKKLNNISHFVDPRHIHWNHLIIGLETVIMGTLRPMIWPVFIALCSALYLPNLAAGAEKLSNFWLKTRGAAPPLISPREACNVVIEDNQCD